MTTYNECLEQDIKLENTREMLNTIQHSIFNNKRRVRDWKEQCVIIKNLIQRHDNEVKQVQRVMKLDLTERIDEGSNVIYKDVGGIISEYIGGDIGGGNPLDKFNKKELTFKELLQLLSNENIQDLFLNDRFKELKILKNVLGVDISRMIYENRKKIQDLFLKGRIKELNILKHDLGIDIFRNLCRMFSNRRKIWINMLKKTFLTELSKRNDVILNNNDWILIYHLQKCNDMYPFGRGTDLDPHLFALLGINFKESVKNDGNVEENKIIFTPLYNNNSEIFDELSGTVISDGYGDEEFQKEQLGGDFELWAQYYLYKYL